MRSGSEFQSPKLLQKTFKGYVVDNDDPMRLERVRVRVHELHKGIEDDMLPWALKDGDGQSVVGDTDTGIGGLSIPVKGAVVNVTFQDESLYNPRYYMGISDEITKVVELVDDDYPHVRGWVDESGNKLAFNNKKDTVRFDHVSGSYIEFDGAGRLTVTITDKAVGPDAKATATEPFVLIINGNASVTVHGDTKVETMGKTHITTAGETSIDSGGDTYVHATGNVNLEGSVIYENCNGPHVEAPVRKNLPEPRKRPEIKGFDGKVDF